MSTVLARPDTDLLAWYDALEEDPPGHRLEILEGVLLVSPSPGGAHQDQARGIAEALDLAVEADGLIAREDFDWRLEHPVERLGSRLRPDVSVLDPDDPHGVRPVTVEVLSPSDRQRLRAGRPETRIEGKRRAYAYGGAQVHVEVEPAGDTVEVRWYAATAEGRLELVASARGDQELRVGGPYPFTVVPDELAGWLRLRVGELRGRADADRQRADAQQQRADAQQQRADAQQQRAERAEAELQRLRDLRE